ncbi:hypothetical protein OIU84_020586 [Salix udensis]|uniref:Uncharacterized protein n=1 Tax=Salix udensis TaxID=889485 RepID=A0AAD6KUR3_9ROSI|nr:hypothetical protein OIU84_020586 [Salix udensis]
MMCMKMSEQRIQDTNEDEHAENEDSDQGKRHYLPQIYSKTGHTNKIFRLASFAGAAFIHVWQIMAENASPVYSSNQ